MASHIYIYPMKIIAYYIQSSCSFYVCYPSTLVIFLRWILRSLPPFFHHHDYSNSLDTNLDFIAILPTQLIPSPICSMNPYEVLWSLYLLLYFLRNVLINFGIFFYLADQFGITQICSLFSGQGTTFRPSSFQEDQQLQLDGKTMT